VAGASERYSCPVCAREVKTPAAGNKFFPFCTERCRAIDLGRWVDEEYRVSEPLFPPPHETEEHG
jgi:endogenous inhibitor of DNA gyrase (YacG/DUF329 family)